jgi:hypothetical protein
MWPDGAQRIVQKYQPGQSVDVHFDPADPDRSSLGISFGRGTIESYCELLMFLFAVALFFFAFPKMLSGSHGGGGGRSGLGVVSRDLEDQIRKYSKYE